MNINLAMPETSIPHDVLITPSKVDIYCKFEFCEKMREEFECILARYDGILVPKENAPTVAEDIFLRIFEHDERIHQSVCYCTELVNFKDHSSVLFTHPDNKTIYEIQLIPCTVAIYGGDLL